MNQIVKEYVVGFMFDDDGTQAVLIRKNRPDWQKGKLNGVGGKVEPNETPMGAMIREFREETGVETTSSDWSNFAFMHGKDFHPFEIAFYRAFNTKLFRAVKTTTDEVIENWWDLRFIFDSDAANPIVPNLRWLVPMALEKNSAYVDIRWENVT